MANKQHTQFPLLCARNALRHKIDRVCLVLLRARGCFFRAVFELYVAGVKRILYNGFRVPKAYLITG